MIDLLYYSPKSVTPDLETVRACDLLTSYGFNAFSLSLSSFIAPNGSITDFDASA